MANSTSSWTKTQTATFSFIWKTSFPGLSVTAIYLENLEKYSQSYKLREICKKKKKNSQESLRKTNLKSKTTNLNF